MNKIIIAGQAGVDEVGRGPLAGPVVAAAVILDPENPVLGCRDSKQLSEAAREALYEEILAKATAVSLGRAEVEEIDEINILQASMLAMRRAVLGLNIKPVKVLVDGNKLPDLPYPAEAIIKGDQNNLVIAAASIVAKVVRDREMQELDLKYPGYGLAKHKGYPTAAHRQALIEHGVTPIHRRSFAPVRKLLEAI